MSEPLNNLKKLLNEYGQLVNSDRRVVEVRSMSCIDTNVPNSPGVYWIETTMPVDQMQKAISEVLGKAKKIRKSPPQSTKLITQENSGFYVAYSGTEENVCRRLKQHLFNHGPVDTVKLGCLIGESPFSQYKWQIGFVEIDSYEFRYAVEAWWRLNRECQNFCV